MIKGSKKNIIHIKNTKNPFVEEMYLVIRGEDNESCEADIIREAEKIVARYSDSRKNKKKKNSLFKLKYLFYGASAVSFLFGIVMLIWG